MIHDMFVRNIVKILYNLINLYCSQLPYGNRVFEQGPGEHVQGVCCYIVFYMKYCPYIFICAAIFVCLFYLDGAIDDYILLKSAIENGEYFSTYYI